jgi:hypothetical protein
MLAWNAEDGPDNAGLWSVWAIDNITVGGLKMDVNAFANGNSNDYSLSTASALNDKAAIGYNVFLDDVLVGENVMQDEFLFSGLAKGSYTAGVQSVYTSGVSPIVEYPFDLHDAYQLTLSTNVDQDVMLMGAGFYNPGDSVMVSANGGELLAFENWTNEAGEIISQQSVFVYIMPEAATALIANFVEPELLTVTFSIDMSPHSGFDPSHHAINVTGSMHNWDVLGATARNQTLKQSGDQLVYSIHFHLPPGEYSYKYFLNEGAHTDEWENGPNRTFMLNQDMEIFDMWGMITSVDAPDFSQVQVFPNPFTDQITLVGLDADATVRITDLAGRWVLLVELGSSGVDTSDLKNGAYLLEILGADGAKEIRKIIKQ